jgi:hypothetical protein
MPGYDSLLYGLRRLMGRENSENPKVHDAETLVVMFV